ncbi:MAG: DUF4097 family beta strand repeat-containing protein [Elusimicrobiaceae bacterium]|nr:DUF4097 family beta strand repeat-containing protein [Elusimicrobiaceae bacterium]
MKIMKLISLLAVLPLFAPAVPARNVKDFDASGIRLVEVKTVAGDISIEPGGDKIKVEPAGSADGCSVVIDTSGSVLRVLADKKNKWPFGKTGKCELGFKLRMPENMAVKAASISGDITAGAMTGGTTFNTVSGDLNFDITAPSAVIESVSGDIDGRFCGPELTVKTVSGDTRLAGLCGAGSIKTVSGDVSLGWDKTPSAGTMRINTISGDAHVSLPAGANARVVRNGKLSLKAHGTQMNGKPELVLSKTSAGTSSAVIGEAGKDGFVIRLDTISGDISGPARLSPESAALDYNTGGTAGADEPNKQHSVSHAFAKACGILLFLALLGIPLLIVVLLLKKRAALISDELENSFAKSAALGALALIAFVPACVALAISILGIALLPFFVILYAVACILGLAAFLHLLAKKGFAKADKPLPGLPGAIMAAYGGFGALVFILVFFANLGSLFGLTGVLLFFLSVIAMLCGGIAGLGAALSTKMGGLFDGFRGRKSRAAAPAAEPPPAA